MDKPSLNQVLIKCQKSRPVLKMWHAINELGPLTLNEFEDAKVCDVTSEWHTGAVPNDGVDMRTN